MNIFKLTGIKYNSYNNMNDFKPVKQEKSVISIRLDTEVLKTIDELSLKTDISRNEFIVQGIEYALKNFRKE